MWIPHQQVPELIYNRIPSAFIVSAVFAALVWRWSWVGLLVASLLMQDYVLTNHATDARPYSIWFALSYFLFEVYRKNFAKDLNSKILLVLFSVLLSLTSLGGVFQILALVSYIFFKDKKNFLKTAALFIPAILISAYYILVPVIDCTNFPGLTGEHSFYGTATRGNYSLVKAIIQLAVSYHLPVLPAQTLAIFGLILLWKNKTKTEWAQVKMLAYCFVSAFILSVVAVLLKNYYFVPRIFIFVLAGKALIFAVLINYLSSAVVQKKNSSNLIYSLLKFGIPGISLVMAAFSLLG